MTAIIVLHYEDNELTNKCISSIIEHTPNNEYHIIVVDNFSPIPYEEDCREYNKDITVIRNDNRDSVSGMNFGFYHALYKMTINFKYIVNFDNDTFALPNWLQPLIDVMEKDESVGIVGGKQWTEDRKNWRSVGADLMGLIHRNVPTEETPVLWIQASFSMYRTKMMHYIGLHDTRYKIICSDSDYCITAVDRGWKVIFTPKSSVIHIGNGSYSKNPHVYTTDAINDKIFFMQKWLGIKFCNLIKEGTKFDLLNDTDIEVTYIFNHERTVYNINGTVTRYATRRIAAHFKNKDIVGVEIGSQLGHNARSLLKNIPSISKLILIDNNKEGMNGLLKANFKDHKRVLVIEKDSVDASKDFLDESIDFVYIDANHSYESIKNDIEAWLPKVKKGGIISGHDYYEHSEFGVIQAVNEKFKHISTNNVDWVVIK